MNDHDLFISVIIPTHNHSWELDKTLFSLEKQYGMNHDEYQIIIINTNPKDKETEEVAKKYYKDFRNIRLINSLDKRAKTIRNATYGMNLGVRQYAVGPILLLCVDSARVPTPGVLRKTRNYFAMFGNDIVTTTTPYHFYKHYSDPNFTPEECRRVFLKTRWDRDIYHLFNYAAHTNISRSGIHNESTWMGVHIRNYFKVGGHNETVYDGWSDYNLDLWRRLTRPEPEGGIQIPGKTNNHWGKIGLGLEVHILEGEADFHLHHNLADAERDFSELKRKRDEVWDYYAKNGDCIRANIDNPAWGRGESEEICLD